MHYTFYCNLFLASHSILSLHRMIKFCLVRPTLHQILFLFRSPPDGFLKPRPRSQTIIVAINFLKHLTMIGIQIVFKSLFCQTFLLAINLAASLPASDILSSYADNLAILVLFQPICARCCGVKSKKPTYTGALV